MKVHVSSPAHPTKPASPPRPPTLPALLGKGGGGGGGQTVLQQTDLADELPRGLKGHVGQQKAGAAAGGQADVLGKKQRL